MSDNQIAMTKPRPRRSMLYVPAANARAMDKAKDLPADMLAFDLEDSIAPQKKDEARAGLVDRLTTVDFGGRELLVRVNGTDTEWGADDLTALAQVPIDGVLLPKIDDAGGIAAADAVLKKAGAADDLAIWCMIETPRGVLQAQSIAQASPRMAGFVIGLNDLGKELRARMTGDRTAFLSSLSLALLAARAYGLAAIDSVYMDLQDADGLALRCRQGRDLGFDGISLIHPKQLAAANENFAPSDDDIAWAKRITAAHAAALAAGQGVTTVDGRLIENLHVAEAAQLLELVAAIKESAQG